ncbi:hypothetical protein AWB79_07617 [Caballeronia hypogeia]|uniref:Uncharacterized protein n=1 Tax=Caballeronia hypogeia TaxID=1777140 RepID=A0A158DYB8_9BURK|nr:hypothetical protein AWB79_07617 [Caballeronia hypogeia]
MLLLEAEPQSFLCAEPLNKGEGRLVVLSDVLVALIFAAKLQEVEIHAQAIAVMAQRIGDNFDDILFLEQATFSGAGQFGDLGNEPDTKVRFIDR